MRLIAAELSGYKRFAARSEMDLDDALICIIGPNGAGKSSFLDALVHTSKVEPFDQAERTRTEDGGVLTPMVLARYLLDDGDLDALADIPEASEVRSFTAVKDDEHGLTFRAEPPPLRDRGLRLRLGQRLSEFIESPWLEAAANAEAEAQAEPSTMIRPLIEAAAEVASSDQETLDPDYIAALENAAGRLEGIIQGSRPVESEALPKKYERLASDLRKVGETEKEPHPHRSVLRELRKRVPIFIKFEQVDRELASEYNLEGEPDLPIGHLLALAGSSWQEVVGVVGSGDKGRKNVLLERLNGRLEHEITEAWGQTPLTVKLDIDGQLLTILMSMQADDYISIDQHSDGLRQFVALKAFLALHANERPPIVLVDEAELHLHYDAQADLVAAFEERDDVAGIIYTTHSAGCLPRDLGIGLRGIVPIYKDVADRPPVMTDHSRPINGFWFSERGFSPLLMAMGASAFAFSAAQRAAVTEGFTDALLLPTLIREACELKHLGYQIVPGFARAQPEEILDFDLLASRVAYIADGDAAGTAHVENKLKPCGVLDEQIVFLGAEGSGLTLEDLIDPQLWVDLVNQHLNDRGAPVQYALELVPSEARMRSLEEWCSAQSTATEKVEAPLKSEMLKALLGSRKTSTLVAPEHKGTLEDLNTKLKSIFEVATAHLAASESTAAT